MQTVHNPPTLDQLICLLLQMGFVPLQTTGSHRAFQHAATDTIFVLPSVDSDERIRVLHLVAVRRTVIERGIVDSDEFDRLLNESIQTPAAP